MKETLAQLCLCLLGLFAVYATAYTIRWHWRKWRWGCSRCAYRKRAVVHGKALWLCTASCGNNDGKVCPAWYYEDPKEAEDGNA